MIKQIIHMFVPNGRVDFALKFICLLLICGGLNYAQDIVTSYGHPDSFINNLFEASFTAVPMCFCALILIGQLNELQLELYAQATTDALTQLPNRRSFMDRVPHMMRSDDALLMIDIDHFKSVNDTYGHDAGDMCLQAIARNLETYIKPGDICARLGGEEFGFLVKGRDARALDEMTNDLCAGVSFETGAGSNMRVTVSIGMVRRVANEPLPEVLRLADQALYQAKAGGRARFVALLPTDMTTLPTAGFGTAQAIGA